VPSDAIGPQAQHSAAAESIEVKELAEPSPQAKLTVAPKPQPLAVRPDTRVATKSEETEPPALPLAGASAPDRALSGIVAANAAPAPVLRGALRISQGVSQGLLVKKVAPVYPAVALRLRKQGAVELLATISKSGSISNLKVLGGDPALAESAVRAVRQWKYRPYLLNSEPVELETQITVNFRLPN
jgi:protein TonB